ncbi:MAG: AAA family ATPase, partial [Patescibacteria group bacterium]
MKTLPQFVCTHCDAQFQKWSGRCLECQHWGTVVEANKQETVATKANTGTAPLLHPKKLTDWEGQNEYVRMQTGEQEIDRVLGGGIVKGSLVLLSGEPGIGKSTLVASIAKNISSQGQTVLYISGEESGSQLKARFDRLQTDLTHISFLEASAIESLVRTIEKEKPDLVIVDSVQT